MKDDLAPCSYSWTNSDPVTADKMVFMYARNSLKRGWWKQVTIVIWGSTATLAAEHGDIQATITELLAEGVQISACKACADELGVSETLTGLGIEVKYWGTPLTGDPDIRTTSADDLTKTTRVGTLLKTFRMVRYRADAGDPRCDPRQPVKRVVRMSRRGVGR